MTGLLQQWRDELHKHNVFVLFASSSIALNAANLLAGVIVLRWIPPSLMGVWQIMLLVESYTLILRMGIANAFNRELPYLLGRGDEKGAREIASTAQIHSLVAGVVVFLGFFVSGWMAGDAPGWRAAAFARAMTSLTGFYYTYLLATYRGEASFRHLSLIQFTDACLTLLMPLFTFIFGYVGLCAHTALQSVVLVLMAHARRPLRVRPVFSWSAWTLLLRAGIPLFATSYLLAVIAGLDKVFLAWRASVATVGLFAPAFAAMNAMAVLPGAISTYVFPKMSFHFGKTQNANHLRRMTFLTMGASIALCLPLAIVSWFAVPFVVQSLVPQYVAAVPAMRVAVFTGMFLAPVSATMVLRTLKAWVLLYAFVAVMGISKFVLFTALVRPDNALMGAAWAGLFAAAIASIAAVIVCGFATRRSRCEPIVRTGAEVSVDVR